MKSMKILGLGGTDFRPVFRYVEEEYEIPKVPPWAIKLVLQHEDIMDDEVDR